MCDANFKTINEKLQALLAAQCQTQKICSEEELENTVNTLVRLIQEVLAQEVPVTKPSPYTKHWWLKELTKLKREHSKLSKLSYHFRGIPNHPIYAKHKSTTNKLRNRIDETKKEHWTEWLDNATTRDIYTTNKYITSKPSDYSNMLIPPLKITNNQQQETLATDNSAKAKALAEVFFPPPSTEHALPATAYPEPLKARGYFSRSDICEAIKKLKPYNAPGEDGIQNHGHTRVHRNNH